MKRPMPSAITPMLATPVEKPFDSPEWLFEIKWDGYRAVAFIENGKVRLVSRNQNDLTGQYPELQDLPKLVKAKNAILDGEIAALDEQGRASFSLMQQRTGIRSGGRRTAGASRMCRSCTTSSICFMPMDTTCGAWRWRSASRRW